MKTRLWAGTINHHADDKRYRNVHLDVSPRGIYDAEIKSLVAPDVVADLSANLPMFPDATFDEVIAHHVWEHMTIEQGTIAAAAVFRVIKPGGILDIEVPDLERVCHAWVNGDYPPSELQQWIYGEQLPQHEPGDSHRFGYWEDRLRVLLEEAGFIVEGREKTGLALRFIARKPEV